MTRIAVAILALVAGLLTVPLVAQPAVGDTGCPAVAGSYSGGTGSSGDPRLISTPGQLQLLRDDSATGWNQYYLLTTNIDMGGCVWSRTIGTDQAAFTGSLDGGGHVISNLNIDVNSSSRNNLYVGLVGFLQGSGTVTRIGFNGSVAATNSGAGNRNAWAGGLVGRSEPSTTISYSFSTANVSASATSSDSNVAQPQAGGLVGYSAGAVIDSYSTGSAAATGTGGPVLRHPIAGGLLATAAGSSSVTRTYSSGVASTSAGWSPYPYLGGLVGQRFNPSTASATFWDTSSSGLVAATGDGSTSGLTGKTTAQMKDPTTFSGASWPIVNGWVSFDPANSKVWGICDGLTRPFLLWQYSVSPCAAPPSAPGAPTITGVTPSGTSASVAFTADDSGGDTITRLDFALDDTVTVDDSTTNIASPKTLSGLTRSTNYTVYMRAVNSQGAGNWSAPVAFRTLGRPGTPVVTAVIPDVTTASVAFTADDSGGATVLSIQYALDDTTGIDGFATNVSPLQLTGLTSGTSYTIYVRAVNSQGPSLWSAASSFTTLTPPPPPPPPAPIPPSPPFDVQATAGDASLTVAWSAPVAPGSFPVTNYQATASPGGRSCMSAATSCTIDGLRNGTSYTVTVRALSGAGWSAASAPSNAVVPHADEVPSLTITGSRGSGLDRSTITVRGTSTGLAGARVTLWLTIGDRKASPASVTAVIRDDGTFTWSRKLNRGVVIYAEADGTRSNAIRLRDVRQVSLG